MTIDDPQERDEVRRQAIKDLMRSVDIDSALQTMSNAKLADLILHHIMADMSMLSPEYLLLEQAVQRLTD